MIYTSYYASRKLEDFKGLKIQISNSKPRWNKVDGVFTKFYPAWKLIEGHKNGTISDKEYTDEYIKYLDTLDWTDIIQYLSSYDMVLLCWCGPGKFCHRHVLSRYLRDKFNLEVKEL